MKTILLSFFVICSVISNAQKNCTVIQFGNYNNSDTSLFSTQYFNDNNNLIKEEFEANDLSNPSYLFYVKSNSYVYLDSLPISQTIIYDGPHCSTDSTNSSFKYDSLFNLVKVYSSTFQRDLTVLHDTLSIYYSNGKKEKSVLSTDSLKVYQTTSYSYNNSGFITTYSTFNSNDIPNGKRVTTTNGNGQKTKVTQFSNNQKTKETSYFYDTEGRLIKELIKLKHTPFSITRLYNYSW